MKVAYFRSDFEFDTIARRKFEFPAHNSKQIIQSFCSWVI